MTIWVKNGCELMPAFHTRTGSDVTSYLFHAGKVKTFKKHYATSKKAEINSDSVELAIKRVHLQTFTWLRYCKKSI